MCSRCYHVAVLCYTALWVGVRGLINDSQAIQDFLTDYNREAAEVMYEYAEASWTFNTNITDYNQKIMVKYGIYLSGMWSQFFIINN